MSEEAWKSSIGMEGPINEAGYEASRAGIAFWCEMVEDANPLYWDEEYAKSSEFGGIICPPSMLMTLSAQNYWKPGKTDTSQFPMIGSQVVFEGANWGVNAGTDQENFLPVRPGDKLHYQSKIVDVVPKQFKAGPGILVTEEITYWNQKNEVVAKLRNTVMKARRGG